MKRILIIGSVLLGLLGFSYAHNGHSNDMDDNYMSRGSYMNSGHMGYNDDKNYGGHRHQRMSYDSRANYMMGYGHHDDDDDDDDGHHGHGGCM